MSPEDTKLATYLIEEIKGDYKRLQGSIDSVRDTLTTLTNQTLVHHREDDLRFAEIGRRFDKLEEDVDDTGEHFVADLRAQVAEAKAAKNSRVGFAMKILAGIILLLAGAGISLGVSKLVSPSSAATK